jgi:hypothetical protein
MMGLLEDRRQRRPRNAGATVALAWASSPQYLAGSADRPSPISAVEKQIKSIVSEF